MLKSLLCWLGFHNWDGPFNPISPVELWYVCCDCGVARQIKLAPVSTEKEWVKEKVGA